MTEILTESFCERCGTRYTFESARPKTRLGGVKVLSRGLKNFVLSDDTSIDEAMAAARSEAEREMSSHQLDAFHKTFSFCMSCRQYTCPNCWNEAEARCLSCAPLALPETPVEAAFAPAPADYLIGEAEPVQASGTPAGPAASTTTPEVDAPFDDLRALREAVLLDETEPAPANGTHPEPVEAETAAEPVEAEADAEAALAAEEASLAAAEAEVAADVEGEALVADEPAAEPAADAPQALEASQTLEAPAEPAAAPAPAEPTTTDPARKASSQTLGLLRRFRPGQNLDAELAAFERERVEPQADSEPEAAPEPVAEAEFVAAEAELVVAEPEPIAAAPEPEPIAAAPEPEPIAAAPEPEPVAAAPEPEPVVAAPTVDVVEQPTWRITAPDTTPGVPAPGAGQLPLQAGNGSAAPAREPQWPSRPEWPSSTPAAGLPFLGRPATPQGGVDALWAASNQELVNATGPAVKPAATTIQPCVSCGLSLSATARFCRRCGTLQAR